jgi:serine phosphatase RsbU (regulator of sigma subunit)
MANVRNILLVEDESVTARDIEYRLTRLGYSVAGIVRSGEEALEQAAALMPDLVIMDVVLDGVMDGIDAAEKIRTTCAVPVVYITAHAEGEMLERIKASGPYGYLLKPVNERELHVVIEIALYKSDVDRRLADHSTQLERVVDERTAELRQTIDLLNDEIRERKDVEEQLRKSEELLRQRTMSIEKDLKNAQVIQRALLPQEVPDYPNLSVDYRYLPLDAIGGDYFSFTVLSEGGMGVCIGDVESHGVSAALFTALVKFAANGACRRHGQRPAEFLRRLNRDLTGSMASSFMTALYAFFTYDDANAVMRVLISSAGQPYPILARKDGSLSRIEMTGHLLGYIETAVYTETAITMERGDRIYFYTDGLIETKDSNESILGWDGLIDVVRLATKPGLPETLDRIMEGVTSFSGSAPFRDDVLIIGFEVR